MRYFDGGFTSFFRELAKNNSTAWFDENRIRYETHVKKPFAQFVGDVISRVQKISPEVKIKPADAITRINKDIRFSKDKTPYNTYVAAIISPAGKKDKSVPGLYVQLSHDGAKIFGGAYVLDPAQLKKVRGAIARDPAGFSKLYKDKAFTATFGSLRGETSKRLDAEWQKAAEKEPLIANKQFYFSTDLKRPVVTSDRLAATVLDHYKSALGLNRFLAAALSGKK